MSYVNLREMGWMIHRTATDKGFWDSEYGPDFILAKLALVHSELSEILEAYRKRMGSDKVEEEFADVIIRLLDLYEGMREQGDVFNDLADVIDEKMKVNNARPIRHGNLI